MYFSSADYRVSTDPYRESHPLCAHVPPRENISQRTQTPKISDLCVLKALDPDMFLGLPDPSFSDKSVEGTEMMVAK